MNPNPRNIPTPVRRQNGVVLLIALIALVALTMTGLALVRSVNATNEIAGNIVFRQSSLSNSDRAINVAVDKVLSELVSSATPGANPIGWTDYGNYYSATMYAREYSTAHPLGCTAASDASCLKLSGIPNRLLPSYTNGRCTSAADAALITTGLASYDSASGNCTILTIERLCTATGAPSAANCVQLSNASQQSNLYDQSHGGENKENKIPPPPVAVAVRVTVRVDGPRGTTSYVQAVLAMS